MRLLACALLAFFLVATTSCGLKGDPKPPTKEGRAQVAEKTV